MIYEWLYIGVQCVLFFKSILSSGLAEDSCYYQQPGLASIGALCAAVLAAVHGDAAGFRAYISPAREAGLSLAGMKRKAPDGGAALPEQPLARGGSLASGRTGSGALREVCMTQSMRLLTCRTRSIAVCRGAAAQ